mmetsp:Transcript_110409/g.235816  ORF Transcript_110409/g.235816 Transcript_110409/m.235816 type:complete len:307 (+) Transcript_110409:16-936(+)
MIEEWVQREAGAQHSPLYSCIAPQMEGRVGHGLRRALLRECRRLGPAWTPKPPASNVLWGRGAPVVDSRAPHPLLLRLMPDCLREGLAHTASGNVSPLAPWLRAALRRDPGELGGGQGGAGTAIVQALKFLQLQSTIAPCTSTSEEGGLRVEAVSGFVREASDVAKNNYVFAYNMRFTNIGSRRLRVLGRQYDFRDGEGALSSQIKPEQPEAAGVVGFTPFLEPGAAFEFGSGVVLRTPRGLVTGRFLVMEEPELSDEDAKMHSKMEQAELMLRFVYLKGLGTEKFHLPVGQLRFDANVPCVALRT